MYASAQHAYQLHMEVRRGHPNLRAVVTDACKLQYGSWELNPGPLQMEHVVSNGGAIFPVPEVWS